MSELRRVCGETQTIRARRKSDGLKRVGKGRIEKADGAKKKKKKKKKVEQKRVQSEGR